jgi:hypothetical protein
MKIFECIKYGNLFEYIKIRPVTAAVDEVT